MENPADVYATGIPMSEKGNGDHLDRGNVEVKTSVNTCELKNCDSDLKNKSTVISSDIVQVNGDYISDSIQDGDHCQMFYNIVCGFDLPNSENASIPSFFITSSQSLDATDVKCNETTNIAFPDSCADDIAHDMDENLDNLVFSIPELKSNKNDSSEVQSENTALSIEEQQKKLNESISAIAKSLGLEDLLPEPFLVGNTKDVLSVTVASNNLCEPSVENVSQGEFSKCPVELHIPDSPLNLDDDGDNLGYSAFGFASPEKCLEYINDDLNKPSVYVKDKNLKYVICTKETKSQPSAIVLPVSTNTTFDVEKKIDSNVNVSDTCTNSGQNQTVNLDNNNETQCILESEVFQTTQKTNLIYKEAANSDCKTNQLNVTVSSPDANSYNDLTLRATSSSSTNTVAPATVFVTADKANKKVHIVVSTSQGQQVFEVDSDNLGATASPFVSLQSTSEESTAETSTVIITDSEIPVVSSESKVCEPHIDESYCVINDDDVDCDEETSIMQFMGKISASRGRSKTWACPVTGCGQVLDKECKFRVHMISHKGARPFKCDVEGCDWAFTTPYRLRRHLETHIGKKDFVCDFEGCNRRFTTVYNLKTHKKRHKWQNYLTCPSDNCGMSFANRRKLELHLRVHKDIEAPYKCSVCGKKYYSANCIASHCRTHQYTEDDFKCPFQGCEKKYDKICRLKQHIRHHTGDRPYICPADGCKWSFMSASKLTRHMRKHTGERKFVCTEPGCGKSFMRPEHLKGHMVIHSGDKPFHCPHENCNAKFTAKSSLYVHVKRHNSSGLKIVYSCPVASCVKKYSSKPILKQHIQKVHPDDFKDDMEIAIPENLELTMPVTVLSSKQKNRKSVHSKQNGNCTSEEVSSETNAKCILTKVISATTLSANSITINPFITTTVESPFCTSRRDEDHDLNPIIPSSLDVSGSSKFNSTPNEADFISSRLLQENHSGSARTDYCCKQFFSSSALKWLSQKSRANLLNNSGDESRNNESDGFTSAMHHSVDIRSPDVMLASSSITFHEQQCDQLVNHNFLPDEPSSSSVYQDDSILVSNSAFTSELSIPVSLLSDNSDSDTSGMVPGSTRNFSSPNGVDEFVDTTMSLQNLDC